jgi:hypothetical protein
MRQGAKYHASCSGYGHTYSAGTGSVGKDATKIYFQQILAEKKRQYIARRQRLEHYAESLGEDANEAFMQLTNDELRVDHELISALELALSFNLIDAVTEQTVFFPDIAFAVAYYRRTQPEVSTLIVSICLCPARKGEGHTAYMPLYVSPK